MHITTGYRLYTIVSDVHEKAGQKLSRCYPYDEVLGKMVYLFNGINTGLAPVKGAILLEMKMFANKYKIVEERVT